MARRSHNAQAGLSLVGLIFLLAVGGLIAVLALRVVPSITEYMAVKKAIVKAKADGNTPAEIRSSFDKQANAGYIESISGKDLDVGAVDGAVEVSFSYEKRIPLFGPASLVIDYEGSTSPAHRSKNKANP